jgi:hypothetical protein
MGFSRSAFSSSFPPARAPDPASLVSLSSPRLGHRHFWQRARSRRQFVQAGGLAVAGAVANRWDRAYAQNEASDVPAPKPIQGGGFEIEGQLLHVYDYIPGNEPSTIGDFRGLVAINHLTGEGTVTRGGPNGGLATPTTTGDRLVYDTDMRIMKGQYIGEDGQQREGTFGFV